MNKQLRNLQSLYGLFETLNRADFDGMDQYFDGERFRYRNVNRTDLDTYAEWKKSPMAHYDAFGCTQEILEANADGNNVWAYMVQYGKHSGQAWMGIEPTGNDLRVEWMSIFTFSDEGRIIQIRTVADVLNMMIQIGVVPPVMPTHHQDGDARPVKAWAQADQQPK
jgi:predicted ester cyclase